MIIIIYSLNYYIIKPKNADIIKIGIQKGLYIANNVADTINNNHKGIIHIKLKLLKCSLLGDIDTSIKLFILSFFILLIIYSKNTKKKPN